MDVEIVIDAGKEHVDPSVNGVLSLAAVSEYSSSKFDAEEEVTFIVSVVGPPYETLQRNSRAPVDLVAVLDRYQLYIPASDTVQEFIYA